MQKCCSDEKPLASINWEQAFSNISIGKKISVLNEAIIKVMGNLSQ